MYYDKTIANEIQERIDLRMLVQSKYNMTGHWQGKNFCPLCPFHDDHHEGSLIITEHRYHCFSCGADGTALSFVKRKENVDYPRAVEILAAEAGVTLPTCAENKKNNVPKICINRKFLDIVGITDHTALRQLCETDKTQFFALLGHLARTTAETLTDYQGKEIPGCPACLQDELEKRTDIIKQFIGGLGQLIKNTPDNAELMIV